MRELLDRFAKSGKSVRKSPAQSFDSKSNFRYNSFFSRRGERKAQRLISMNSDPAIETIAFFEFGESEKNKMSFFVRC